MTAPMCAGDEHHRAQAVARLKMDRDTAAWTANWTDAK